MYKLWPLMERSLKKVIVILEVSFTLNLEKFFLDNF